VRRKFEVFLSSLIDINKEERKSENIIFIIKIMEMPNFIYFFKNNNKLSQFLIEKCDLFIINMIVSHNKRISNNNTINANNNSV